MRFFFFEVGDCEFDKGVEAAGEEGARGEVGGVLSVVAGWPLVGCPFEGTGAEAGFAGFCPHMRPRHEIRENLMALPWSSPLARDMN